MFEELERSRIFKKVVGNNPFNNTEEIANLRNELYSVINQIKLPIGSITIFSSNKIPNNWLLCDGSTLSINSYLELFKIIGTTYGGDGVTNFVLPNLLGRAPIGSNPNYPIGSLGGKETHTLKINELPTFSLKGKTDMNGVHKHNQLNDYGLIHKSLGNANTAVNMKLESGAGYPDLIGSPISINEDGNHSHTFITESIGLNQPHNIMQPYLSINYIIKYN
jgi:microcystin-dependent protein